MRSSTADLRDVLHTSRWCPVLNVTPTISLFAALKLHLKPKPKEWEVWRKKLKVGSFKSAEVEADFQAGLQWSFVDPSSLPGNETPWDHEKLPFSTLLKKSLGSLRRRITSALMKETWKFKNWLRWRDPFIRPTWHMLRVLWRTLPSVLYEATSMSSFVRSRTSGGLRFVQKLEISERCLRSL